MGSYIIGVDIGGTRTKYGLVNISTGEIIESIVQSTEKESADKFLIQITKVVQAFETKALEYEKTIAGIGFGIPGFVEANGNIVTTYGAVNFMEDYPLKTIFENEFSLPCLLDNDARVVALGEALYGKGRGYDRVLTLTLGTPLQPSYSAFCYCPSPPLQLLHCIDQIFLSNRLNYSHNLHSINDKYRLNKKA